MISMGSHAFISLRHVLIDQKSYLDGTLMISKSKKYRWKLVYTLF